MHLAVFSIVAFQEGSFLLTITILKTEHPIKLCGVVRFSEYFRESKFSLTRNKCCVVFKP